MGLASVLGSGGIGLVAWALVLLSRVVGAASEVPGAVVSRL
jgi:hypothetical protein